ncbi:MAG: hypothetical protein J0G36_14200 [Afipia sp.]|mgnify:CR=1 FL=1|jgi:hypothetical protein|nr:hypothetical protein [Afipia sp.]
MRRFVLAAIAVAALSAGASLTVSRAEAMPLNPSIGMTGTQTEEVRLVCTRFWNGYRWDRRCRDVRPHYVRPHRPHHIRPHHRGPRHHHHRHHR